MNVDKFGRHEIDVRRDILRGPKGEGFLLTHDGNYDMRRKRLCNLENAVEDSDSVNLAVLKSKALTFNPTTGVLDARNERIINVAAADADSDAVNRQYVQHELHKLKLSLEETIKAIPLSFLTSTSTATEPRVKIKRK